MKLVVLTGIPGSGSTTVLKKTLEEVDYLHLNYGDIMTEIAVEKGLVENRDELRKLPADTQKEIQKEAGLRIKEKSESENVIVDTHCTISTPAGFLPGKDIQLHQEMNRAAAMAYATLTGATVKIINNHDNHLPSTVRKMVELLK